VKDAAAKYCISDNLAAFEEAICKASSVDAAVPRRQVVLAKLQFHLGRALAEELNRELAPAGVTFPQWQVLIWLAQHPEPFNPSQICGVIDESPAGITRLTDDLVERGWIARQPCTNDRRRVELRITAAGHALVKKTKPLVWGKLKRIYSVFTKAEMQTLEELLKKLLAVVEKDFG
jgi:MarR family transcriptional repressor of emrRAB